MFVSATDELSGPKWVINFPTKKHWRNPSKIEWVREGLEALKEVIREKRITSIAIPPLGCGNGGLNWSNVRPLIQEYLNDLTDVEIIIYEPTEEYLNKPENP
jgi:O-acetyl-ADP-ribose deacetylase (regulator of RNase III)